MSNPENIPQNNNQQPNSPQQGNQQGNQQGYQQNYQPGYQQPYQAQYPQPGQQPYAAYPQTNSDVTVGEWLISFLILLIPIVNIVMMFVWAFSSTEKRSKSNYFKASLIMAAIGIVLSIVFSAVIGGIVASVFSNLNY